MLSNEAGASLLSWLVGGGSGLGSGRGTVAGRFQVVFELLGIGVGEHRCRPLRRHVVDRGIGRWGGRALRATLGQAAGRSRQAIGDGAAAARQRRGGSNEPGGDQGATRQAPQAQWRCHVPVRPPDRMATAARHPPLTLQRKIAARSTNCVEAVGSHYGETMGLNGLDRAPGPRSAQAPPTRPTPTNLRPQWNGYSRPRLWVAYQWGEGVLSEARELRRLAEQCLRAARATSNLVERRDLLARAQVWLELAQWLEEQERQESLAPPPVASEHAQPPSGPRTHGAHHAPPAQQSARETGVAISGSFAVNHRSHPPCGREA